MNSKEMNKIDRELKKKIDGLLEIIVEDKEELLLEKIRGYCDAFEKPKKHPVINEAIRTTKNEYFGINESEIDNKEKQRRINKYLNYINELNKDQKNIIAILEMLI